MGAQQGRTNPRHKLGTRKYLLAAQLQNKYQDVHPHPCCLPCSDLHGRLPQGKHCQDNQDSTKPSVPTAHRRFTSMNQPTTAAHASQTARKHQHVQWSHTCRLSLYFPSLCSPISSTPPLFTLKLGDETPLAPPARGVAFDQVSASNLNLSQKIPPQKKKKKK